MKNPKSLPVRQAGKIQNLIKQALAEDVGSGDITTNAIIPKEQRAKAVIMAKEAGVIAGLGVASEVFRQVDRRISFVAKVKDGAKVKKGKVIATLFGPAQGILTAERVALNFLQHLSGVATLTNRFVKKLKSKKVKILDTRKTIPGLRLLEKQAVRVGGGTNHRMGLWDAILIKDNHLKLTRGVKRALEGLRRQRGQIEIETKTTSQVKQAIKAGADRILLDNMSPRVLRQAVKLCKKSRTWTEASGGVNLDNVRRIASTGVNAISIGALTHSAPALDISLKVL